MTRSEQKRLVKDLCNRIRDELLEKSNQWPEEWDGIELRELVAYAFSQVVLKGVGSKRRTRDARNEILVRNLY